MISNEQIIKWNDDWDQGIKNYLILDNVLPKNEFNKIQRAVTAGQSHHWSYTDLLGIPAGVEVKGTTSYDKDLFMMSSMIFDRGQIYIPELYSSLIKIFSPLLQLRALSRIKCNLYPATHKIQDHAFHVDYPFTNKGAIYYLNTCDGYTKMRDETKIDSVENRLFLFDSSTPHCSSTCTDQKARFNINLNYY